MVTFSLPQNEPVKQYVSGSTERISLHSTIDEMRHGLTDIPMFINGKEIYTQQTVNIHPPHDLNHVLGRYHYGTNDHVRMAIDAALGAHKSWSETPSYERAEIFSRAADLAATTWRNRLNAATMLCQSKNVYQAEIDSACELIDFLRFNVYYQQQIETIQPSSPADTINKLEYRPLEGFIYALTPFNFTAISANLPTAPALMGNTVVWRPAESQIYAAWQVMLLLREAGLPDGVINLVYSEGISAGEAIFSHRSFAGLHFTGSTNTFNTLWQKIASHLPTYHNYPRIVGETGGKNFVLTDGNVKIDVLATALIRGAFEYQGQKCSAASRAYIPKAIWPQLQEKLIADLKTIKMGPVEDFHNFINAVIDEKAFNKISVYIDKAKANPQNELIWGGKYDKTKGYFIEPTIFLTKDPNSLTMREEIFGPVLTIYLYENNEDIFKLIDETTQYALTGAVLSEDKAFIEKAKTALRFSAGNFYINDKPTGAVVNQQPFGGGRASGTNDKAGSMLNLLRWTNPRAIKENLNPPSDYRYPFLG